MWHHWWISAMIFSSHLVGSSSSPPSSEEEGLFPSRSCTGCQLRRIKLSSEICSRTGKALVGLSAFGSCDDDSARSDMDKHSSPTWNSSGAAALAGDDGTGFSIFQCGGTCGGGGSVKGASCRPTRTRTKAIQLDLFSLESSGDAPSPFSDAWSEKGENQREERINKMSRNGRSSSRRRRRGGGGRGKGYR